ncbi:MAG: FapA family protein [Lachnospiraceae bacterium]|nr:FapA family protein [Lachnospiraceae bacterium]
MKNGYFRLIKVGAGYGVHLFPPVDGGEPIRLQELMNYLDNGSVKYDLNVLKAALAEGTDKVVQLGVGECPKIRESYVLGLAEDNMSATARFYPASDTGERMTAKEFIGDLNYRMVRYGVQEELLNAHFEEAGLYCTDMVVAKGLQPRHGTDARIEYFFNTDLRAKPEMKEDGSVDFFHLNLINPVKVGQELARIIPADEGDPGMTIQGTPIRPREVKKVRLEFGRNIKLSADRMSISSEVDGLVMLTGGQVFVNNVYEVENVDNSTGNIDFTGNVQVNGNVNTNFVVKATGDVIVMGVVEGATIEAGGNIIIARGMNGMAKGVLKAGQNVVAKFIENAKVSAEGYVETESILHSEVCSGTEVLVAGKHGFITGGRVQADQKVEVKTLGSVMGAATIIEVGVNPALKTEYVTLQKEIAECVKTIKQAQPVIQNFMEKKAKGVRFTADQLAYVKQTAALLEAKKVELQQKSERMKVLAEAFDPSKKAEVRVTGEVYPGATIVIGDLSLNVKDSYQYCKFVRDAGEVKMQPL